MASLDNPGFAAKEFHLWGKVIAPRGKGDS